MIRPICSPRILASRRWIQAAAWTPPVSTLPASSSSASSSLTRTASAMMSSSPVPALVDLDMNTSTGIATLTLLNPPVNSLSLDMNTQILDAVRKARQEPTIQALIVASSNPKVFCAGLDLNELYPQSSTSHDNKEASHRLIQFWKSFQQLYIELYGCHRLAVVAALEGHAVAGGCMVALCADYRIMSDDPRVTIGLNESQLGIVAPPWLGQQLVDTVGRRTAELGLMRGTLWNPNDALRIGLVDQLVPTDQVRDAAHQVATELIKVPESARALSKKLIRQNRIDRLVTNRQDDVDNFVSVITHQATQKRLGMYLASLAKKR